MAFVGFFFTLLLGLYMIFVGVQMNRLSLGFTGKISMFAIAVLIMGIGLVYTSIHYAPFTITVTQ